jgi:DNA-binding HxlR family transcriptional regulator
MVFMTSTIIPSVSGQPSVEIPPCGCGSPGQAAASTCYCSVEDLLKVIRRRYSLAVMNAIHRHQPARYKDLSAVLATASSSTLAETLGALEAAQLVERRTSDAIPTSTYALTGSGEKLLSRLRRLLDDVHG